MEFHVNNCMSKQNANLSLVREKYGTKKFATKLKQERKFWELYGITKSLNELQSYKSERVQTL